MTDCTLAGLKLPQPDPPLGNKTVLDLLSLRGKVASITGGSNGIGWAVAEAYAQAGADLAIWYNSRNPQAKADALAQKYGVTVRTYQGAITDSGLVESTIQQQVHDFGKIDVFVANAGVAWDKGALIEQPNHDEWNRVMDVDLHGTYYCAKSIGQQFKRQGFGSLIFTASVSARLVNIPQKQACYNAAKAAVTHLARSLAVEWAGFARVNCVSPGFIRTDILDFAPQEMQDVWWQLVPMGRCAQPSELGGAYVYLASDASTYTTGADLVVDGGYTLP